MSNKFSYVKIISRDACTSCGNHTGSHMSWWPDDEIHLFMGIPLCWSCITKMVFQWEKMKVRERSGIDNETYGRYMMDIENEVDKLNEKVNTGGGVYKTRMEDLFARECVKHSLLRVIDLKNEKGWFDHIVEGMSKDADQYKGVLVNSKVVFDPDYFIPGKAVRVQVDTDAASLQHLRNGTTGILRGIQDETMLCIAVYEPLSGEVYDIIIPIKDILTEKTTITFLENEKRYSK